MTQTSERLGLTPEAYAILEYVCQRAREGETAVVPRDMVTTSQTVFELERSKCLQLVGRQHGDYVFRVRRWARIAAVDCRGGLASSRGFGVE